MPICSVGMDLCVMVLFAVDTIQMTTNAVEFLTCIARAATEKGKGFLPSSIGGMVTNARTDQFVGVWDIVDLISTYANEIEFRLMSIEKLQACCAYQEYSSLVEIFGDFRECRDGKIAERQLRILRDLSEQDNKSDDSSSCISTSSSSTIDGSSTTTECNLEHPNRCGVIEVSRKNSHSEIFITETPTTMDILFSCGPGNYFCFRRIQCPHLT